MDEEVNNHETSKTTSKQPTQSGRSVSTYAAQCDNCFKWRVIPTQEEYEELRTKIKDTGYLCNHKRGVSCDDPADIEYGKTKTWVLDRHGTPKTPEGFERISILRKDFSKMDTYYVTPTGKRLRTRNEIAAFIEQTPEYKNISVSDFSFNSPKIMENTIPKDVLKVVRSKKKKLSNEEEWVELIEISDSD